MIPKIKILFIEGSCKGEKYLLEPSLDGGKSEFIIGHVGSDIEIPDIEGSAVISFKVTHGWVLYI